MFKSINEREVKMEIFGTSKEYRRKIKNLKNFIPLPEGGHIKKRRGFKFIKEFSKTEPIVSMIEFKGRIIIATSKRIYELKEEKIIPIEIRMER